MPGRAVACDAASVAGRIDGRSPAWRRRAPRGLHAAPTAAGGRPRAPVGNPSEGRLSWFAPLGPPMRMTALTTLPEATEQALNQWLRRLDDRSAVTVRTLVHAWASGGGGARVGAVAVRLLGRTDGTAAVVRAPRGEGPAALEFARVLMESHGVSHASWVHWSDEFADLAHHGFDPAAKFPTLKLDADVTDAELARLAVGLRDLAAMAARP